MWYERLPHLNALLNFTSFVLLTWGWLAIRSKKEKLHARLMCSAFVTSTLFLASYLTYHFNAGRKAYVGPEALRTLYLAILLSHTVLAVLIPPLSITVLVFAIRKRFDRHRRLARWTLPIWIYVSITGVIVYLFLYGDRPLLGL